MWLKLDSEEQAMRPRLEDELVNELYRRTAAMQLIFLPGLYIVYLALHHSMERSAALFWAFVVVTVLIVPRTLSVMCYERIRRRFPSQRARVRIFAIGSALLGFSLGTLNVLAAPVATFEESYLFAFALISINSITILSMNPNLGSYFLSMLPSVGSIPIVIMMGPRTHHQYVFMAMVMLVLVALSLMAVRIHRDFCREILTRFKLDDANVRMQSEVAERHAAEQALAQRNAQLEQTNARLADAQNQLLQSEKLASIGQLAAGVAHEINNPVAFVRSNLLSLRGYVGEIETLLKQVEDSPIGAHRPGAETTRFLREDIPALIDESIEGATRIERIVKDLRDFSHLDASDWQLVDLHRCLETTLSIAAHELKFKTAVVREYGELPRVQCLPFQINQVFLNLLINAAHAIDNRGMIWITTGVAGDEVFVRIRDNGSGIDPAHLQRIFDPFFTTKPVGVGTGLGLSVSYSIIRRHRGTINVESEPGVGTTFTIRLPIALAELPA